MDENKEVNSTDPMREKVRVIPLSAIDDDPTIPLESVMTRKWQSLWKAFQHSVLSIRLS